MEYANRHEDKSSDLTVISICQQKRISLPRPDLKSRQYATCMEALRLSPAVEFAEQVAAQRILYGQVAHRGTSATQGSFSGQRRNDGFFVCGKRAGH
jgi:hypothetical protein